MSNKNKIKTRMAPSPTGFLHVGTARTAIFNFLFTRHFGGEFILRIEDTDLERSEKRFEEDITSGLKWLGIDWDGDTTRQSERVEIYKKYIEQLLRQGDAFYCFHSEKELENEKKLQINQKLPTTHICEWRDLSLEDAEKKRQSGCQSIIRFKIPRTTGNEQITFLDMVRNQVHFFVRLLGDFSIAKSPDIPLYNFAVVVDDHEMEISHIIRGEDHISNTPKQLLIADALGWTTKNEDGDIIPAWKYAHLPLLLGSDRSKLSKRHGATSISEYREAGYLSEAIFNFLTILGWNPGTPQEIFSKKELIKEFSLERVQKAGAIFDTIKLDWMNGEYIRKKTPSELMGLAMPFFNKAGLTSAPTPPPYEGGGARGGGGSSFLEKIIALEQPRLKKLSELPEKVDYFFKDPEYSAELLKWKNMSDSEIKNSLEISKKLLEAISEDNFVKENLEKLFLEKAGKDRGELLWPLRVALTGKKTSPGPFEIMEILGKALSIHRISTAISMLK